MLEFVRYTNFVITIIIIIIIKWWEVIRNTVDPGWARTPRWSSPVLWRLFENDSAGIGRLSSLCQAFGYLPSHRASPPRGRYHVILLGDRGTYLGVNNLPMVVPSRIWSHDLMITSPTLYLLCYHTTISLCLIHMFCAINLKIVNGLDKKESMQSRRRHYCRWKKWRFPSKWMHTEH